MCEKFSRIVRAGRFPPTEATHFNGSRRAWQCRWMTSLAVPEVMTWVDALLQRARASGRRQSIGIVGAPGAGKSTVANLTAEQLGRDCFASGPDAANARLVTATRARADVTVTLE